ncbi:transmembrane EMP24 domain-containing protein [Vairimorpha necatrix]|uniref:Transmembrane EMP24 domain-containing protein n=1 Tax=Vairimorpha necatrix TaxID=6039 RepID=A0AAX4JAZ6_9MICR
MFFLLFLTNLSCEILMFNETTKKREIVFDVTGDQICKGYFQPTLSSYGDFKISIITKDGHKYFETEIYKNERKDFSFNVTDNKDLICTIIPSWPEKSKKHTSELEVHFETQFDTFRKDVAKQVRVEPATYSLTKIGNVMQEMNDHIDRLIRKMSLVEQENKKMFFLAMVLSSFVLCIYVFVEVYLLQQLRNFFKTKKLI